MSDSATCRDPAALTYVQRSFIRCAEINASEGWEPPPRCRRLRHAGKVRYRAMLDTLAARGYTRPRIERCLGIPQRSLRAPSRENYALVEMVTAMPWLLRVAESGHHPAVAAEELRIAAEATRR